MKLDLLCSNLNCPPLELKNLGKALKEIRKVRNYTQGSVSEETGWTIHFISCFENGRKGISRDNLNKLAKLYNIPSALIDVLATPAYVDFKELLSYVHSRIDDYL